MSLQRGKVLLVQTWCSGPAPAAPAEAGTAPGCLTRLSGRGKGVLGLGQWAPAGLHQLPLKVTTAQETYPREPWGSGLGPIPSGQDGVPWPWLGSVPSRSPGDIVSPLPGSLFRPQHPPYSCWQNLLTAATHCPLPVGGSGPRWQPVPMTGGCRGCKGLPLLPQCGSTLRGQPSSRDHPTPSCVIC